MGTRRGHILVLLLVLGLVAIAGLISASKETKLGLDLPVPEGANSLF